MSAACILKDCDSRNYAFKLYRVVRQLIQRTAAAVPRSIPDFITVSAFSKRVLAPMLPTSSRYHAVQNPVDAVFGPRVSAEKNAAFIFVGRLSAEKGGLLLAEAARRANAEVVFVGDGPELAEISRVNPNANCIGWVDRAAVLAHLRAARFIVVPSMWYETLGLVVLEAAALGIPAIVPTGTAACDLVQPNVTGLTFERGNVDALVTQMKKCSDDDLVSRLSRAAYDAFWKTPPTMNAHVDQLLSTYYKVLESISPQALPAHSR